MMWTPLIFNIDDITDTLRSWVHEYLIPFMTFSLRLVNNDTLKWYSDNFPYITYTSTCIHGENYVMYGKLWEHNFNVPQSQGEGPTTEKISWTQDLRVWHQHLLARSDHPTATFTHCTHCTFWEKEEEK